MAIKKYEKALIICFALFLLIFFLGNFWFSLLALLTPLDMFPHLTQIERFSYILDLIVYSFFIFLSGKTVISGRFDSSRKVEKFTLGLTLSVYLLIAPTFEICQELLDRKQLLTILSTNEDVMVSISLVLMSLVIVAIAFIRKQLSKFNYD